MSIESPESPVTVATCLAHESLVVSCLVEQASGAVAEYEFPVLIYDPAGALFSNGGFAGTFFEPFRGETLNTVVSEVVEEMLETGSSTFITAINGWYGWPNSEGYFAVEELHGNADSRGYTVQIFQLTALAEALRAASLNLEIEMRTFPYKDDARLQSEYQSTGGGIDRGFKMTPGFIEGVDGKGLRTFFTKHVDFFVDYQDVISMVYLGAETSDVETMGGAAARQFYREIIQAFREAGYESGISHVVGGNWETTWHWDRVLNPSIFGFPWSESSGPAVTSYVPLAFSSDENPSREVMEARAEEFVATYYYPLYKRYGGRFTVEDMYCYPIETCLYDPVGNYLGVALDIGLASQWLVIWIEALLNRNLGRDEDWIRHLNIGEYRMMPNEWVQQPVPDYLEKKGYLNPGYNHEALRAIVSLYFRDVPKSVYSARE